MAKKDEKKTENPVVDANDEGVVVVAEAADLDPRRSLRYVGPGFLPGVPAADHEAPSATDAKALVKSGIYEYAMTSAEERAEAAKAADAAKAQANAKKAEADAEAAAAAEAEAQEAAQRAQERRENADAQLASAEDSIERAKSVRKDE